MKTLFYCITALFLSCLLTVYISCDPDNTVEQQLILDASSTETNTDESILFTVTADGDSINDVQIEIDGSLTSGNTHTFTSTGTHQVIAKKEGFEDSDGLNISVSDVYATGREDGVVKVWKNGTSTNLTDGSNTAWANSIYINEGDVYAAGFEENSQGIDVAVMWVNGKKKILSDGSNPTYISSIYVSEGDVYAVGYEFYGGSFDLDAVLWKNGVKSTLSNSSYTDQPLSVYVYQGDIYVAGHIDNKATLWKNGDIQEYSSLGNYNSQFTSVFVDETGVYVSGFESNGSQMVAKVWKNGTPQLLSDGSNYAEASSVYVSNSDIYVAGREGVDQVKSKLWKNGTQQSLSTNSTNSYSNSVYVSGENVYVAGKDGNKAAFWKNGKPQAIADILSNSGEATSVFVDDGQE